MKNKIVFFLPAIEKALVRPTRCAGYTASQESDQGQMPSPKKTLERGPHLTQKNPGKRPPHKKSPDKVPRQNKTMSHRPIKCGKNACRHINSERFDGQ